MRNIASFIFISLFLVAFITGCSTKELERSAEQLSADGQKAYAEEDYEKAVADLKKLKEWYPFSKHVILAEQKIADAYFKLEKYNEAISSYEEFEKLHPNNELIPYINYQKALCHFLQIDTIDRDQKHSKEALKLFNRLKENYTKSEYAQKSVPKIKKCEETLAGHEFYVGEFYFKSEHYKGALKRFETVVNLYPNTSYVKRAKEYISLCSQKIK